MRGWLLTVVLLAVFTSTLPPNGDQRVDRFATIIVIATLAMGAITVRRPIGLRIMLGVFAAFAFVYMCTTLDAFQPSGSRSRRGGGTMIHRDGGEPPT